MNEADDSTDGGSRKPKSVREGIGADDGQEKDGEPKSGRRGGPVPARGSVEGDEPRRPTPVRQAMEAEAEGREPLEPPSLRFEMGGESWIARVEGRTETGRPLDEGAPLLFVTFARAEEPERRVRETVAVGRRLDDLAPADLGVLLDDSRPYDEDWEGSELFPETRKSRKPRS